MDNTRAAKILIFISAMAIVFFATALFAYSTMPPTFWQGLDLNGKYIWLPDIVANFFDGSKISLHFFMFSGEKLDVCGTVLPGSKIPVARAPGGIHNLSWGACGNFDYDVSMSDTDAVSLATSTTPIRTFANLMDSGNIRVVPYGENNAQKLRYGKVNFYSMDGQEVPQSIRDYFSAFKAQNESG